MNKIKIRQKSENSIYCPKLWETKSSHYFFRDKKFQLKTQGKKLPIQKSINNVKLFLFIKFNNLFQKY